MDEETGYKLRDLWFPGPERIKLKGIREPLYAYRVGEGTDKERVVVSNRRLSAKRFESYYRVRWDTEHEIRTMKGMGLESYMVRRLGAIRLKAELSGMDLRRYLLSFVMPDIYLLVLDLLKFLELLIRRGLRFSPFPDDRLVLFLLKDLIGSLFRKSLG